MLQVTEHSGIIELSLARPCPVVDAPQLALELLDACRLATERADPLTAVVLRGQLDGFFVEPPSSVAECDAVGPTWAWATAAIASLSVPTIAVVLGQAVGPGWELALACDLRIASDDAVVGSRELRWARIPAAGGVLRLVRLVGATRALPLLLSSELLTGAEAARLGLVHRAAPRAELEAAVEAVVAPLRSAAPIALGYTKEAAAAAARLSLTDGLRLEADLAALLLTTADRAEGISAFLDRRPPSFKGA